MKENDGRKLKHEVLTELRKRAVQRVQDGESPGAVIRTMGFSRACIYNSFRSDYHAGTTWSVKGRTPVVRSTGARHRLNMLSAVNRRGQMRFMIEVGGLNAGVFCRFLTRMTAGTSRGVFLVVDGHPMHKSKKVSEKVKSYKGRLRLYVLPPYSPELNPDEGVWREVKAHHLGRMGVWDLKEMKSKAFGALRHLVCRPDKVRAFFQTKTTIYAG